MEIYGIFCYILLVLSTLAISEISGLKCHSCLHVGGVFENEECRHGDTLLKTAWQPCDSQVSAINSKEILATRAFSPEIDFHLMCLKSVVKAGDVDIIIRGCYGQRKLKSMPGSQCEIPHPRFWQELREGPLAKSGKQVDLKSAKVEVCVCDDREGCNGGNVLKTMGVYLCLLSFAMILL